MLGKILDAAADVAAWVRRRPDLRADIHERRSGFWSRRHDVLRAAARSAKGDRRERLMRRAAMAAARRDHHKAEADRLRKQVS